VKIRHNGRGEGSNRKREIKRYITAANCGIHQKGNGIKKSEDDRKNAGDKCFPPEMFNPTLPFTSM
jgi:hypothetical protein